MPEFEIHAVRTITYTNEERATFIVEAGAEGEARELAELRISRDDDVPWEAHDSIDKDVESCSVEEVEQIDEEEVVDEEES